MRCRRARGRRRSARERTSGSQDVVGTGCPVQRFDVRTRCGSVPIGCGADRPAWSASIRSPESSPPRRSPSLNEATMLITASLALRSGSRTRASGPGEHLHHPLAGADRDEHRLRGALQLVVQLGDALARRVTEIAEVDAEAQPGLAARHRQRLVEPGELHRGERVVGRGRIAVDLGRRDPPGLGHDRPDRQVGRIDGGHFAVPVLTSCHVPHPSRRSPGAPPGAAAARPPGWPSTTCGSNVHGWPTRYRGRRPIRGPAAASAIST